MKIYRNVYTPALDREQSISHMVRLIYIGKRLPCTFRGVFTTAKEAQLLAVTSQNNYSKILLSFFSGNEFLNFLRKFEPLLRCKSSLFSYFQLNPMFTLYSPRGVKTNKLSHRVVAGFFNDICISIKIV